MERLSVEQNDRLQEVLSNLKQDVLNKVWIDKGEFVLNSKSSEFKCLDDYVISQFRKDMEQRFNIQSHTDNDTGAWIFYPGRATIPIPYHMRMGLTLKST